MTDAGWIDMIFQTDYPMLHLGDEPGKSAITRRVRLLSFDGNKYVKVKLVTPDRKGHGDVVSIKAGYLRVYWQNGQRGERTLARSFGKFLAAHQVRPECDPVHMHFWADGVEVHYDCAHCKGVGIVCRPDGSGGWVSYRCCACKGRGRGGDGTPSVYERFDSGELVTFAEIQARHSP